MTRNLLAASLLLALLTGASACDAGTARPAASNPAPAAQDATDIGHAMSRARQKMNEGNIGLSGNDSLPKAEITPRGDLLIAGKAVPMTAQQRALALDYRGRIIDVAGAGIDVGAQGANLAVRAVGEALRGVFTGNTDAIEQRVEKQAEGIRQAALRLCDRLPAMRASQQALAAALPAFVPYATMTEKDITECRKDATSDSTAARHIPTPPSPPAPPAPEPPPAPPSKSAR